MDRDLQHVCDLADTGKKTKSKLLENQLTTFQALLTRSDVLDPAKGAEKDLLKIIKWYKHWLEQANGMPPDITKDFTEDAFEQFKATRITMEVSEDKFQDFFRLFREEPEIIEMAQKENLIEKIQGREIELIKSRVTPKMERALHSFDVEGFAREVVNAVYKDPTEEPSKQLIFVAGKTQSGKSSVKAVKAIACFTVQVPLIIITKGVSESIELVKKLKGFVAGTPLEKYIMSISKPKRKGNEEMGVSWKTWRAQVETAMRTSGTIVCADTAPQIRRVIEMLEHCRKDNPDMKFVTVIDECDAVICRTDGKTTQIETEVDRLKDMGPLLTVLISATPVPLMLEVVNQENDYYSSNDVSAVFTIEPMEEYSGVQDMVLLKDNDNSTVFLDRKELSPENNYTSSCDIILIQNALQDPSKKGVLLLDCTNPRVYADGNVRAKASRVQELCANELNRDIVVMINIGSGISVRVPGEIWQHRKGEDVDEVIEAIDKEHGLETPIFCFGFTKMRRGISYRSANRVPTHFILVLGGGHNIMNLAQTLGRATFNGKFILAENGFEAVTLLAPFQDYITVQKLTNYIDHIFQRIKSGETFSDALTGANAEIPDAANFFRHTPRRISQLKRHRQHFATEVSFQPPSEELSHEETEVKKRYFGLSTEQKVLRTIFECTKFQDEVHLDDVQDGFNDTFGEDGLSISKQKLKKILKELVQDSVIHEKEKDGDEGRSDAGWYKISYRKRLRHYINDNLALTRIEQGFTLEVALGLETNDSSVPHTSEASCDDHSSLGSSDDGAFNTATYGLETEAIGGWVKVTPVSTPTEGKRQKTDYLPDSS